MNALAIRNTLKSSGPKEAEKQLALVGHNQGDEQLALVVAELSPGEVGLLLEQSDFTKPSTVSPFLTPEQLVGALERHGAKWGGLRGSSVNALANLKREMSDLVSQAILHRDDAAKEKLLRAVLKNSLLEDLVVTLPLYEHGAGEVLEDFDANHAQHGTWQELYAKIHEIDERAFGRLRDEVLSFYRPAGDDDDAELLSEPTEKAGKYLEKTLQALSDRAAKLVEKSPVEAAEADPFERVT